MELPEYRQLHSDQIYLIKSTWEIPRAKPSAAGEAILLRFFEKYPQNQNLFDAFRNTPLESLKTSTRFKSHAGRIIKVFDRAVVMLEPNYDLKQFESIWGEVANSHFKINIPKSSFFELRDVILEVLTAVCNLDDKQQEAWNGFFDNIFHIIFQKMEAYQKEYEGKQ